MRAGAALGWDCIMVQVMGLGFWGDGCHENEVGWGERSGLMDGWWAAGLGLIGGSGRGLTKV